MNTDKLISEFYTAFAARDHITMRSCYHPDAVFKDEVFELSGNEIGDMWEMLCSRGKDLKIEFEVFAGKDGGVKARWEAKYTFSSTRRKVHNIIDAEFHFKEGRIIKHTDRFDFWRWARQALGFPGYVLGWSSILKKKVRQQAADSLNAFISNHSNS